MLFNPGGFVDDKRHLKTVRASAALSIAAALAPGIANAQDVLAGPPPSQYTLDARGVDVTRGTFNYQTTEVVIGQPGQGGLAYTRTFAGPGWRDDYTGTVEQTSTTRFVVSIGGQSELFDKSGTTYTPVKNLGATLTKPDALTFRYVAADGTVALFYAPLADRPYNPAGGQTFRITRLTRPSGEVLSFAYHEAYLAPEPWDPEQDKLVTRLEWVGNSFGYGLNFEYAINNPTSPNDEYGFFLVTRITGVNGSLNCAYDACPVWPSATYTHGPLTLQEHVTDSLGRTTTYDWGGSGIVKIRYPGSATDDVVVGYAGGKVASVTAGGSAWTYAYADTATERTTTTTDALSNTTVAKSTLSTGLLTSWRNEVLQTTSYVYDAQGRVRQIRAPEGNYVDYTRDTRGNITLSYSVPKLGSGLSAISEAATYPATCAVPATCNLPTTTTDARGGVTDYTYAPHGGLATVTAPAPTTGAVRPQTRIAYAPQYPTYRNGSGVVVTGTAGIVLPTSVSACSTTASCAGTADEVKTSITYGSSSVPNTLLPTVTTSGSGDGLLSATTTTTYTPQGDILTVDGPLSGAGDTTRYRYDVARQLVGVIGPDPDASGPLLNRAQRLTYNPRGQVTLTEAGTTPGFTDPDWAAFTTLQRQAASYDAFGRPVVGRAQAADGTTLAVQQVSYDLASRPECSATRMNPGVFASLPGSACALGTAGAFGPDRIVKTIYDAASRPLSTVSGFASTAPITESVNYTANGKPQILTDGSGNVSVLVYDGFDRTSRLRYPNPVGGGTSTTDYEEYGYDAASNVVTFRNRAGSTIGSGYDALNRQITMGGSAIADRTFTYDSLSRLTATSFNGGGPSLALAYDALGRVVSETQSPTGTVGYQYDLAGRRTRITWPDTFYATYEYDLGDDLISVRENGFPSWALATYAYDNLGRRIAAGLGNGVVSTYAYDGVGRLSQFAHTLPSSAANQVVQFGYNPAGQILTRTNYSSLYNYVPASGATTYANDGLNRVTGLTGTGATSIGYDANKNITTGLGATYGYNAENQLTAAGAATFTYDPLGRLYQSTGSATRRFLYDGVQAIGEYDAGGTMISRYVPGIGLNDVVTSYIGSGTTNRNWPLADERQSVIAIANGSGVATSINTYDEYGIPGAGNAGRFQYTGQMWLPDAGLYHYRARGYAPQLGRFLQPDPIGYAAGANLYAYVGGDPVNMIDPSGLRQTTVTDWLCSHSGPPDNPRENFNGCRKIGSFTYGLDVGGGPFTNNAREGGGGRRFLGLPVRERYWYQPRTCEQARFTYNDLSNRRAQQDGFNQTSEAASAVAFMAGMAEMIRVDGRITFEGALSLAKRFGATITAAELASAVRFVAAVVTVHQFTENWVDRGKMADNAKADVARLCGV